MNEVYLFEQVADAKMKTRTSYFGTPIQKGDKVSFVGLLDKDNTHITIVHIADIKVLFDQYEYIRSAKDIHMFRRTNENND